MKVSAQPQLHVKIMSPSQTHFDGPAVSVSAVNKVGAFDILADHANFFSLLSAGDVTVNTGSQQLTIPIKQGILKNTKNNVMLFIDIEAGTVTAAEDMP